jgi:hypothetical protein
MQTVAAVKQLLQFAKKAANHKDETITSKAIVPPTGDKRTYVSLATYCWPSNPEDLEHPKGPWKCIDGKPFLDVRCAHLIWCSGALQLFSAPVLVCSDRSAIHAQFVCSKVPLQHHAACHCTWHQHNLEAIELW